MGRISELCHITHILHPDFMVDKDNKTHPDFCYTVGLCRIVKVW